MTTATLHAATLTSPALRKHESCFVLCVAGVPVVAVNGQGRTVLDGGRQEVRYSSEIAAHPHLDAQELAEDYADATGQLSTLVRYSVGA